MYTFELSQAVLDTESVVAGRDTLRTIQPMEKWFDRVRSLMRRDGVTQDAMTEVLGVKTRGAVGHYLSGRREPSIDQLTALAALFDVSLGWIVSGHPEARDPSATYEIDRITDKPVSPETGELEFVGHMDAWDSNTPLDDDEVELPLFREVELAAGAGQTEVVENQGAKLRFAKSTLARAGVQKENAACAFVRGNSMEPVMPDRTCVGVNTGDTTVRDGEIYAIDHGGMLRVKYLHRRPGGGIKIVSQNASEYPVEDITADEMAASVRIIGRVFWWSVLR